MSSIDEEKDRIDRAFPELALGCLFHDVLNDWRPLNDWGDWIKDGLQKSFPIAVTVPRRYAERIRQHNGPSDQGFAEAIISKSDPTAVAEYDALVDEVRRRLPDILSSGDYRAAQDFYQRAKKVTRRQGG